MEEFNHFTKGSSPLTRGGPSAASIKGTVVGLIPAYAGRT